MDKNPKYLIQIGSASGNDFFYHEFVAKNPGCKVILVEPAQPEKCRAFYEKKGVDFELIERAIVPNNYPSKRGVMYKYGSGPDPLNITSLMDRTDNKSIDSFEVDVMTINELLSRVQKDCQIAMLFIDAEGADREILLSLDLAAFPIKNIIYEAGKEQSLDKNRKFRMASISGDLHNHFLKHGYLRIADIPNYDIFRDNEWWTKIFS